MKLKQSCHTVYGGSYVVQHKENDPERLPFFHSENEYIICVRKYRSTVNPDAVIR